MDCLDDNAASEFVSGALAAPATAQAERHLASCRDCRDLVAALAGTESESQAATRRYESPGEAGDVPPRPALSIGARVGRYVVLASLGSGGMGVVFTAYDPQLDRKVALKLLRANLGVNPDEARTRLKREAQAIAQLNHPNVVAVYDVGTTPEGDVYIAMEFVEGDTLKAWLKKWPRSWRDILEVYHQAGRGLMAAHSVGLLHRDFKPDNVLVGSDGRVRVTDFGLARSVFLEDSARGASASLAGELGSQAGGSALHDDLTATGAVLGTPRYMAPDQLAGASVDARADQFSFCVALYEALYGMHPLPGATSMAMLESEQRAQPPPEASKVPASITRAVMRGLEKERQRRFPTMAVLLHELSPPSQRSPSRLVALAAMGALVVTGATAAVLRTWWTPPEPRPGRPVDDPTIPTLSSQIAKKDAEIKQLRDLLAQREALDGEQLRDIQRRLDEKTQEVQSLTYEIIKLKARQVPVARPLVAEITGKQVTEAIQRDARSSIAFCLRELEGRAYATEGAPRDGALAAVVRLSTTPAGVAFDVTAAGMDFSPSVRLCIEEALARVVYPRSEDSLDLRVTLSWNAGTLVMAASVLGQRAPGGGTLLDL